jgi:DNA polymerase-3 subunit gamma/tau
LRPAVDIARSVVPDVSETVAVVDAESPTTAVVTLLEPESVPSSHGEESTALDLACARKVWPEVVKKVGAGLGWRLSQVEPTALASPDVLVIAAKPGYNAVADECGTAESLAKIAQAFQRVTHRPVTVKYERSEDEDSTVDTRTVDARRADVLASDPMIQKIVELFEARSLVFEYEETDTDSSN